MDADRKKPDNRKDRYMVVRLTKPPYEVKIPHYDKDETEALLSYRTFVRLIGKDKKLNFMKFPAQATAFTKANAEKIVKDMGHMYNFKIEPLCI